jgi:hypothetical protein
MKICSKCKIEKEVSEFKRYQICIDCNKILNKIYNDNRKNKMKEYYLVNKEIILDRNRLNYIKNQEYIKDRNKEYAKRNRSKRNSYLCNRRKVDSLFNLTLKIRNLIYIAFYNGGFSKKSKTNTILGCSFEEFKIYIESQFQEGMTWENQGEWHLDHKIPISWADSEEKIYELNYYTNFQPLWAKDNQIKGNRWSD